MPDTTTPPWSDSYAAVRGAEEFSERWLNAEVQGRLQAELAAALKRGDRLEALAADQQRHLERVQAAWGAERSAWSDEREALLKLLAARDGVAA